MKPDNRTSSPRWSAPAAGTEPGVSATVAIPRKPESGDLHKRVLKALDGVGIEPVPVAGTYTFALTVVALATLLLPLIYFGLIFLFTYGAYWHAVRNRDLFKTLPGAVALAVYLLPILVGPVLALFMVKPFFVRQAWRQHPQRLKRDAEPFLHDYVDALCDAIGAPRPRSIRVTCAVTAAAEFRRGLSGVFGGRPSLLIGLPLAAGLTLRQLTGILAHEFGHFSQGVGIRVWITAQGVNGWFERAVYQRDAWDVWLVEQSEHGPPVLRPLFYLARAFVWLNRRLMWGIMMLGHVIGSYVSREQEFNADQYTGRLVGGDVVGPTLRRTTELGVAFDMAMADLNQFWDEGRLADNLPRLIVANLDQMTPDLRKAIVKHCREQETKLFDTHPSDRERTAAAREEAERGAFRLDEADENRPAALLFSDFDRLCRVATLQFYRENVDPRLPPSQLHSVESLIERQKAESEAAKALHRYFQTRIPALRPLPISEDAAHRPEDPDATGRIVSESRRQMLVELAEYRQVSERYEKAESRLFDVAGAQVLLQANVSIRPDDFGLGEGTREEAAEKLRTIRSAIDQLAARLLPFEQHAGQRLSAALQLLQLTRVQKRIEDGDVLHREVAALLPEAQFVSGLMAELPTFRILVRGFVLLFTNIPGNEQNPNLRAAILSKMDAIHTRLASLHRTLGDQLYPFDHAKADMTLREYALPALPDPRDAEGLYRATEHMFEKLVTVQIRLFARLAQAAETVETALGLPPLPDPEDDEKPKAKRKRGREK